MLDSRILFCRSFAHIPFVSSSVLFNIHMTARTDREIENETFTSNVGRFWQIIEWERRRSERKRRRRRRRIKRRGGKKGRPSGMTLILERGVIATLLSRYKDEKHTMSKCLLIAYRSLSVGASNPTTCGPWHFKKGFNSHRPESRRFGERGSRTEANSVDCHDVEARLGRNNRVVAAHPDL